MIAILDILAAFLAAHWLVLLGALVVGVPSLVIVGFIHYERGLGHGYTAARHEFYRQGFNGALDAVQEHCGLTEADTRRLRKQ